MARAGRARRACSCAPRPIDATIQEFPDGNADRARRRRARSAAGSTQIVKSLVFVCDGEYVLALVPGDRRADEREGRARRPGAREVRVATADEVRRRDRLRARARSRRSRTEPSSRS